MRRSSFLLKLCFAIVALADAFCSPGLHPFLKTMLMPLLALSLSLSGRKIFNQNQILAALFFSWIGDVLLLFENSHALFFTGGLSAFLLAHICYIRYFLRMPPSAPSLLRTQPWTATLTAAYGISLMYWLWPYLGNLRIPVSIYAVVICSMLCACLHAYHRAKSPAGKWLLSGAVLFALSDSLLALNKFYQSFDHAGAAIILTYCAAQYCLVEGATKNPLNTPAATDESSVHQSPRAEAEKQ